MNQQPLRILQFTDTHLYAEEEGALLGINTQESLRAVLELAQRRHWPTDLVLATGDLTHDASAQAYGRFVQLLEPLGLPVYCLPGNHDEALALRRHLNSAQVQAPAQVLQEHWQLCLLDTALPGSEGGHLATHELERLQEQLQAHPDRHTLICLHHQPVLMGSAWLDSMAVDNADELFGVLDQHPQVRGILWGHVHQDFDQWRDDVRLLATPSTCIQFAPGSEDFALDDQPPGYRWLHLYPDGRIDTGVERLAEMPGGLDMGSGGY